MNEPSPHPDPVPGFVPDGFMDEQPPHPEPVSGPVPEWFLDEPPPHLILFLVLFRRGPKPSQPHTLFLSMRGSWMDCLHSLLLFPVLSRRAPRTNCLPPWFPFRRSSWRTCLHFLFLSLRGVRTHPLRLLCLVGDLQGLAEGPSSLCTTPLSSAVGSPGPATGCQFIGSYVTGLLIACPYVAHLLYRMNFWSKSQASSLKENHEHCGGGAGPHDTMKTSLQVLRCQLLRQRSHRHFPTNLLGGDKPGPL
ncbi:hypothetical protein CHARACLAT_016539, partial [Characodon lateralis]|nr:hypothetical protein [Characodon lateralis]